MHRNICEILSVSKFALKMFFVLVSNWTNRRFCSSFEINVLGPSDWSSYFTLGRGMMTQSAKWMAANWTSEIRFLQGRWFLLSSAPRQEPLQWRTEVGRHRRKLTDWQTTHLHLLPRSAMRGVELCDRDTFILILCDFSIFVKLTQGHDAIRLFLVSDNEQNIRAHNYAQLRDSSAHLWSSQRISLRPILLLFSLHFLCLPSVCFPDEDYELFFPMSSPVTSRIKYTCSWWL